MFKALQNTQESSREDIQILRLEYGIVNDFQPYNISVSLEESHLFKANQLQVIEYIDENLSAQVTGTDKVLLSAENDVRSENFLLERDEAMCVFQNESVDEEDPFDQYNIQNTYDITQMKPIEYHYQYETGLIQVKSVEMTLEDSTNAKKTTESSSSMYKFFCSECPLRFCRIGSYRLHLNKKHGIPLPTLTCSQCSKIFKSEYDLKHHMKTHLPPSFSCPKCDRKFQSKDYVATHIKFVHEDIRPFVCEECGESTRTKASLREHMLTHSDYAPFGCDVCKKRFKNRSRLKKHFETHSSAKHTCGICGLQLNSRATLNRHKLVHSNEMLHKCDYCGRGFKRAKTLKMHLLIHSGLRPYSCEFCDKTFANGSNCRKHKVKIHPDELTALEASGEKTYTKNIPKLDVLKTVTQIAENLLPVVAKHNAGQKKLNEEGLQSANLSTSVTLPSMFW